MTLPLYSEESSQSFIILATYIELRECHLTFSIALITTVDSINIGLMISRRTGGNNAL
jgi:hypothetical protein